MNIEKSCKIKRKPKKREPRENLNHFTFNDRLRIEAWYKAKVSVKEMAEILGKDQSSVYRELNRGKYMRQNSDLTFSPAYSPDIAERKYRENLKAKGTPLKIGSDIEYAEYIENKIINEKYSPKAVLGEINRKKLHFKTTISAPTLYRYIDEGLFLHLINKDLPVKRNKKKKSYHRVTQARPSKGDSIEQRPEEIDNRDTSGHWEMDCVVGSQTTPKVLLVMTERKTRREIVRRWYPKGESFMMTTDEEIAALEEWMNKYPREMFEYDTADS